MVSDKVTANRGAYSFREQVHALSFRKQVHALIFKHKIIQMGIYMLRLGIIRHVISWD